MRGVYLKSKCLDGKRRLKRELRTFTLRVRPNVFKWAYKVINVCNICNGRWLRMGRW